MYRHKVEAAIHKKDRWKCFLIRRKKQAEDDCEQTDREWDTVSWVPT